MEKLYSGTNSNDSLVHFEKLGRKLVGLKGRFWTNHPGEAMDFACVCARRHEGKMVVLALPEYEPENFEKIKWHRGYAVNRSGEDSDWYTNIATHINNPKSTEQKSVIVYTQEELPRFIEEHCRNKENERRWFEAYIKILERRV